MRHCIGTPAVNDSQRNPAPERPAAEIPLGQTFRWYVVKDDQVRPVESARADREQAIEHVLIFAAEQPATGRAPDVGRVRSDALQDRATDDGIAAHEDAVVSGSEGARRR